MKKFNTKRSVSEKNKICEIYQICYFLFSILIYIDITIKFNYFNFYDIYSTASKRWLDFEIESIFFVIIFFINIIMLARKGITIGTGDLPKDIFQKRKYARISAIIGLIISVSLWIFRLLMGIFVYPNKVYAWKNVIWMLSTFIVVSLILYLTFFIAYKIAIKYKNSNETNKINDQLLITQNSEKNKIYKICYFLFLILIYIDLIIKFNFYDIDVVLENSGTWIAFVFEFLSFIIIFYTNIIMLAVQGITIGIGDLPNNVFHKRRYASISAKSSLIIAVSLFGFFLIRWFIGWDLMGFFIYLALFLLTFIVALLLLYTIFYIGYKIALEHNNRIVVDELKD